MNKKYESIIIIIVLILITMFVSIPLINKTHVDTHDGLSHVSRVIGLAYSLEENQPFHVIVSRWTNGFGYSWNLFYPPLITYFCILLKPIIATYSETVEYIIVILNFITIFGMYGFMKEVTSNKKVSAITAMIYLSAPYRITDMYVRMALGEIITLSFLPILFWGFHNLLYGDKKKDYLITIGACAILLSHNISSIIVVFISFIYFLVNIRKVFNKEIILKLIINVLFICMITSYFFIPLLESKNTIDYSCFEKGFMMNKENMYKESVHLKQLFIDNFKYGFSYGIGNELDGSGDMNFSIGYPLIIGLMLSPLIIYRLFKNKEEKINYLYYLGMGLLCMFLTTFYFPWNKMPDFFSFIQVPYRFLMPTIFLLSVSTGMAINYEFKNIKIFYLLIILGFFVIYIYPYFNNLIYNKEYSEYPLLTENNSNLTCANYEYLPYKARTNMDYISNRKDNAIIISGKATIIDEIKDNTQLTFTITDNESEELIIELPYIYYIGYNVTLNDRQLDLHESDKGFIEIIVNNKENGEVKVSYTGTTLMKVSRVVSILSTVVFVVYALYDKERLSKIVNKAKGLANWKKKA